MDEILELQKEWTCICGQVNAAEDFYCKRSKCHRRCTTFEILGNWVKEKRKDQKIENERMKSFNE